MTWTAAIADYVTAMAAANRAPGTIRLHRHYLRQVATMCPNPWAVHAGDLERAIAAQRGADGRKSMRGAVRSFYRWAHGRGWLDDDPAMGLPSVKVQTGRRRSPAPELVVSQLVDDGRQAERLVFMGELGAFNGLRACEIAQVNRDDLDEDGRLTVRGKGGKVRVVPITDEVLLERIRGLPAGAWAFPNGKGSHLSPGHVTRLMSQALPGRWTAHTLRHRFATVSNKHNPDLMSLAELLGHASVATTQLYVATDEDQLRAAASAGGRRTA